MKMKQNSKEAQICNIMETKKFDAKSIEESLFFISKNIK